MKKQIDLVEECLIEAQKAYKKGEVPIGAIVVKNGKIISRAYNTREHSQNALHHAEIIAINKACKKLKSWRLDDCEMFVSLEPCPMCAGAILNCRLKKINILCLDDNYGAVMSKYHLLNGNALNHKTEVEYIENPKSKQLIQSFFKNIRKNKSKSN